jgi:nitrogen regulatory protein P-II 1
MKEIKAFIPANRIGDVIAALKESAAWTAGGERNLTAHLVQGLIISASDPNRHYSVALGDEAVNEYKLEVLAEDDQVVELVDIIKATSRGAHGAVGWVYVADVVQTFKVG